MHDVRWRNEGGYVEVEYSIENHLPGQTWYRNDFIRVFQHGVGLEEEGGLVSRVLLKGAEIRFVQTFLARDGSTPVIQVDSSYASGRSTVREDRGRSGVCLCERQTQDVVSELPQAYLNAVCCRYPAETVGCGE